MDSTESSSGTEIPRQASLERLDNIEEDPESLPGGSNTEMEALEEVGPPNVALIASPVDRADLHENDNTSTEEEHQAEERKQNQSFSLTQ